MDVEELEKIIETMGQGIILVKKAYVEYDTGPDYDEYEEGFESGLGEAESILNDANIAYETYRRNKYGSSE